MRDPHEPRGLDRSELLQGIRRELSRLHDPVEVLAEQVLGLNSRIDWLGRDGRGQAVLVLLAEAGDDLRRLAEGLAQRAWAEPRIEDWLKLAPELGLRPELGARVLLLSPSFDERTRAAAGSLDRGAVSLALVRYLPRGAGPKLWIDEPERDRAAPAPQTSTPDSIFRTGLRSSDL